MVVIFSYAVVGMQASFIVITDIKEFAWSFTKRFISFRYLAPLSLHLLMDLKDSR